ncbi:MAG: hypothetical protein WAR76_04065 [Xanthobacteraceae bacterium]|jgi:hypothetical protein
MNLLNMKVALSALGIVAMLASPAFAQKRQDVTHPNRTDVSKAIPGYDKNGATLAIPDPDSR